MSRFRRYSGIRFLDCMQCSRRLPWVASPEWLIREDEMADL
jgi:hypothetical protein